ncbi:MAG: hypothetical protein HKN91_06050 [Acidimicrobiia bacterium]|nr:hypothetical protein [Acidimicrobiia bacterium]
MQRRHQTVRLLGLLYAGMLVIAACGGGPDAPTLGATNDVCIDDFCVNYPEGWTVAEQDERFVSFTHPESSDLIATVGRVNLEGIAVAAGAQWPVAPRDVVDLLWSILDGGDAEVANVMLEQGGVYDSWGFISTGRLWHRLVPVTASRGIGVEVRAPNASWEPHADVFRSGLVVLTEDL